MDEHRPFGWVDGDAADMSGQSERRDGSSLGLPLNLSEERRTSRDRSRESCDIAEIRMRWDVGEAVWLDLDLLAVKRVRSTSNVEEDAPR